MKLLSHTLFSSLSLSVPVSLSSLKRAKKQSESGGRTPLFAPRTKKRGLHKEPPVVRLRRTNFNQIELYNGRYERKVWSVNFIDLLFNKSCSRS
ncbi:MAG: hypothetical protein ACXWB9_06155, partial [Flavisolibacter sp.]